MCRKKESAHDPKLGGIIMVCACMAAFGTGSLIFFDDVTNDGSSRRT